MMQYNSAALFNAIKGLAQQWDDDEARWWVNDSGPVLNGELIYRTYTDKQGHEDAMVDDIGGLVGIVDETVGGMIAYARPEMAETLCDKLNVIESINRLVAALNQDDMPKDPDEPETYGWRGARETLKDFSPEPPDPNREPEEYER